MVSAKALEFWKKITLWALNVVYLAAVQLFPDVLKFHQFFPKTPGTAPLEFINVADALGTILIPHQNRREKAVEGPSPGWPRQALLASEGLIATPAGHLRGRSPQQWHSPTARHCLPPLRSAERHGEGTG